MPRGATRRPAWADDETCTEDHQLTTGELSAVAAILGLPHLQPERSSPLVVDSQAFVEEAEPEDPLEAVGTSIGSAMAGRSSLELEWRRVLPHSAPRGAVQGRRQRSRTTPCSEHTVDHSSEEMRQ